MSSSHRLLTLCSPQGRKGEGREGKKREKKEKAKDLRLYFSSLCITD
jgi:hypothetical protein